MKRRITYEDLHSLTKEQVQKLRDWWNPNIGDWFYNPNYVINNRVIVRLSDDESIFYSSHKSTATQFTKNKCMPLLDIGQMIDILKKKEWVLKINQSNEGSFRVELDCINGVSFYRTELCNALWNAVKFTLEERYI